MVLLAILSAASAALAQLPDRADRARWIALMNREAANGWWLTGLSADNALVTMAHLPVISKRGSMVRVCTREDFFPAVSLGYPTENDPTSTKRVLAVEEVDCAHSTLRVIATSNNNHENTVTQAGPGSLAEGLTKLVCSDRLNTYESAAKSEQTRFLDREWCKAHS
jgi:hypothetical protein